MFTLVVRILIGSVKLIRKIVPHFGMRKILSTANVQGPWWENPDSVFYAQYIWEDDLLPALEYCLEEDD